MTVAQMDGDFDGRTVVITGGTGGIGWRCATLFAARGAQVVACGHDPEELAHAGAVAPARVYVRAMDVRDEASIAGFFEADPLLQGAGIDALVNCAGIQRLGTVEQTSLETWNAVLAVNLTGTFLSCKYALPLLRRRGGGAIVNVSSIHARVTGGARAAYVASKSAVLGLSRAMALDHGPENIRVNTILPGAIDTPMLTTAWKTLRPDRTEEQMRTLIGEAHPIGRIGTPHDVAAAIVFLCSPDAAFMTGVEIAIDGGITNKLALPVTRPPGAGHMGGDGP